MTALAGMARPTTGIGSANSAIAAARKLGLSSSLKLCLDAGDAASAPSSPTKWLDLSGNGYDFNLGADGTHPGTDEPTLNGTPGQAGTYFGFDDSDFFTCDAANEAWMQNLHKDNALLTIVSWVYPTEDGGAGVNGLFGTGGNSSSQTGVRFLCQADGSGRVSWASATAPEQPHAPYSPTSGSWLVHGNSALSLWMKPQTPR